MDQKQKFLIHSLAACRKKSLEISNGDFMNSVRLIIGLIGLLLSIILVTACTSAPDPELEPVSSYLKQANTLIHERRYSEAIHILEEAAEVHPASLAPLLRIGQIYLKQQRHLLAEDAFNRALARNLQSSVATAGLAETILQQGQTGRALELWRQAITLNPNTPGVFSGLGRTYLVRLDFEAARQAFLDQQKQQPDPEAAWFLAVLAAALDIEAAQNHLRSIPAEAPSDIVARRDYLLSTLAPFEAQTPPTEVAQGMGLALTHAKVWPLAIYALTLAADSELNNQTVEAAEAIRVEKAETLAFLGYALAQAGQPALDILKEARDLDPTSAWPIYFYGLYLRQQGALKAAEVQFEQAINLDPDNAAIYIELARTKAAQGEMTAAETLYDMAVVVSEDDAQILLVMTRFYATRGYKIAEAGIPLAESIVEDDPTHAIAHDLLGWMQFLNGEPDKALTTLQQAIELDPNLISAHYHLARVLEQQGQSSAAKISYQRVIDWDTGGVFRDRALLDLQQLR